MTKKEVKKLLKDYKDFLNKDHKGMYSKISDYSLNKYIKEQLTLTDVVVPKGTLFCECLTPELLGRYTELKNVCKCGKTVAK